MTDLGDITIMYKHTVYNSISWIDKIRLFFPYKFISFLHLGIRQRSRASVRKYFNEHPEAQDAVWKATYAYHNPHLHDSPHLQDAHSFSGPERTDCCIMCHRTREQVRWDNLPPECLADRILCIKKIIKDEEQRFYNLLLKAKKDFMPLFKKYGSNGQSLSILHHTYGYDLEIAKDFVNITKELEDEYNEYMERERELSRDKNKQNKKIITIVQ